MISESCPPCPGIRTIAFRNLLETDIAEIGLHMDSPKTLAVSYEAPALELARQVDARGVELIVVHDEGQRITGVVYVPWCRNQIAKNLQVDTVSFEDALTKLIKIPGVTGRPYRHEWLAGNRPPLVWCSAHKHWASSNPCR